MKYKPYVAAAVAGLGLMAVAAPAPAFTGDEAIVDGSEFRLNPRTLEPGCFLGASLASTHLDLSYLNEGQIAKELHIRVRPKSPISVDQVLVPSKFDGYAIYGGFDTGTVSNDPDIDPDQTAVDMFAPDSNDYDGPDPIDKGDIVVCVSDHNDSALNRPYVTDVIPGEVAAIDRPIIQPVVSCLGVSAIEPLNTYKVGFGYVRQRWYMPFQGLPVTDPQHYADHVLIKYRADQPGVRRVNDIDESGEAYSDPHSEKSNYGQPVVFHRNGDPQSYLHKSLPGTVDGGWPASFLEAFADQTSALGLFTFTAQGDLPITWTLKASLAPDGYRRSVTLDNAMLRAWEAEWQAAYDSPADDAPDMPLCPGTNAPARDSSTTVVVNPPAAPAAPASTTTVIREVTNTVTTNVVGSKKAKSAKKACMKKAKAKKGKAKKRAMRKCRRR